MTFLYIFCLELIFSEPHGPVDYGYCQAGMGAAYTADGEDMIMGAVGAKQSRGEALGT